MEHYGDVMMDTIASQITSPTIVFSTVYSDADQTKHQSSASLAFVRGIHRGPGNSPHKWPVTRKMFPFNDVIMFHATIFEINTSTNDEKCRVIYPYWWSPNPHLIPYNCQRLGLPQAHWDCLAVACPEAECQHVPCLPCGGPLSIVLTQHSWWRHDRETLSTLLAICEGNPSVTDGFPSQRTQQCGVFMFPLVLTWQNWTNCQVDGDRTLIRRLCDAAPDTWFTDII